MNDPTYKRLNFCQIILGSPWDDRTAGYVHEAGCPLDRSGE